MTPHQTLLASLGIREGRTYDATGDEIRDVTEEEMASIYDVKRWLVMNGITHIVASERNGWTHTLCGVFSNYEAMNDLPLNKARLCRKCRERLKSAKPVLEQTESSVVQEA